jgi:hypothetical protein
MVIIILIFRIILSGRKVLQYCTASDIYFQHFSARLDVHQTASHALAVWPNLTTLQSHCKHAWPPCGQLQACLDDPALTWNPQNTKSHQVRN